MDLNLEQARAFAKLERDMDSGAQPFVLDERGRRWAFPALVLDEAGCVSGQTVSGPLMIAVMQQNFYHFTAIIALEKASGKGDK